MSAIMERGDLTRQLVRDQVRARASRAHWSDPEQRRLELWRLAAQVAAETEWADPGLRAELALALAAEAEGR